MSVPRARTFGAVAAAYAEHRPEYPTPAVDWALEPIADRPDPHLLDLGAGTGKLTGALLPRGTVTAVEPDTAMLDELRRRFPAAVALAGGAEAIPLPDTSVDAVVAGQAWHWFDPESALPEITRVLRPGGVLAALWNNDDTSVEWVRGYQAAAKLDRTVPEVPAAGGIAAFPEHRRLYPSERATFSNPVRTSIDGLIATLRTHSWALLTEPAGRDTAMARVRDYLEGRPETSAAEFVLPVLTGVVRAERR